MSDKRDRVRKLLAVADPKSGATEAERSTAQELADRIMRAEKLTVQDVLDQQRAADPVTEAINAAIFDIVTGLGKVRMSPDVEEKRRRFREAMRGVR